MNAKKQARRDRAAKRFTIIDRTDFMSSSIIRSSHGKFNRFVRRVPHPSLSAHDAEYASYVVRKQQEAASLGIKL